MYWAYWTVKTAFTALLAVLGLAPVAVLLYPWPIAWYWWRGQRAYALGLLLSCLLGIALGAGMVPALVGVVVAALGLLLGEAFARQWSFGRVVCLLSFALFGMASLNNAMNWENVKADTAKMFRFYTLEMETAQAERGESLQAQIDTMRWLHEHVEYFAFGSLFGSVLLFCTALVAFMNWAAKKQGASLLGRFGDMRPPDALVWLAIACAVAAWVDYQWPVEILRIVSWNTGMALAVVYWLNGVACAAYFVATLQLNFFLIFAMSVLVIMPAAMPFFTMLGFFDTWLELREKADRLAAYRKKMAEDQEAD